MTKLGIAARTMLTITLFAIAAWGCTRTWDGKSMTTLRAKLHNETQLTEERIKEQRIRNEALRLENEILRIELCMLMGNCK